MNHFAGGRREKLYAALKHTEPIWRDAMHVPADAASTLVLCSDLGRVTNHRHICPSAAWSEITNCFKNCQNEFRFTVQADVGAAAMQCRSQTFAVTGARQDLLEALFLTPASPPRLISGRETTCFQRYHQPNIRRNLVVDEKKLTVSPKADRHFSAISRTPRS